MEFIDEVGLDDMADDEIVLIRIQIGHAAPLDAGDVALLLEDMSTVSDVVAAGGERTYFDEHVQRWRLAPLEEEREPEVAVLEVDAHFAVTLAVVVGVASIIGNVAAVAGLYYTHRSQAREQTRDAREAAEAAGIESDAAAVVAQALADTVNINSGGGEVNIYVLPVPDAA